MPDPIEEAVRSYRRYQDFGAKVRDEVDRKGRAWLAENFLDATLEYFGQQGFTVRLHTLSDGRSPCLQLAGPCPFCGRWVWSTAILSLDDLGRQVIALRETGSLYDSDIRDHSIYDCNQYRACKHVTTT